MTKSIIRKLITTEKSLAGQKRLRPKFTFSVDRTATKHEIKAAFEAFFGVKALRVNTGNTKGRIRRRGRQRYARILPPTKKAVITLTAKQPIPKLLSGKEK